MASKEREDFEHYHETKFIEALTSIIDQREVDEDVVEYLYHTLRFLPFNSIVADAWVELLKLMNAHVISLKDKDAAQDLLQRLIDHEGTLEKKYESYGIMLTNAFQENNLEEAMTIVNKQLELVESTEHVDYQIRSKRNKGTIYHVSGQLEAAEKWYHKAYKMNDTTDSYQLRDQNVYALGNLYQHYLGDFDKALEYYTEGRDIAVADENIEREAFFLDHMGMAEYWRGNFEKAIKYHEQAVPKISGGDKSINLLFNRVQMAQALAKLERFQEIVTSFENILELKAKNTDPYSNSWFLLLLSDALAHGVEIDTSKFKEAIGVEIKQETLIREAKSLADATRYIPAMVYSNIYLAKFQMEKDPTEALSLLSQAKHLAASNNRIREVEAIKKFVRQLGLDYDTI